MIQLKSILNVADNSGGLKAECIRVCDQPGRGTANLGHEIVVVIKSTRNSEHDKVKKGDIHRAVVVRTRKETQRKDGSGVRFEDNACVLVQKGSAGKGAAGGGGSGGALIGSRVVGVVANEVRRGGWTRILRLAQRVI